MRIEDLDIRKGGNLTINSIFEFDSCLDVTMLIEKCRKAGCTVRFENEDLTIDSSYGENATLRAMVTLYTLMVDHPKAAQDYYNYLFKNANAEEAPDN